MEHWILYNYGVFLKGCPSYFSIVLFSGLTRERERFKKNGQNQNRVGGGDAFPTWVNL